MTRTTEQLRERIRGLELTLQHKNWEAVKADLECLKELLAVREAQPYGYLRENDGQVQISIGPERPPNRSGGYATPWGAIYAAPPAPAPAVPSPITFSESDDADKCRTWAWEQVKKDVTTDGWTAGDSCNFYGFYCWGWDMRRQYNEQRAPAVPDDTRRMDWLVAHHVEVRKPLLYGSEKFFTAQTMTDKEDDYHATSLREQIDAAMAAAPTPTKAVNDENNI